VFLERSAKILSAATFVLMRHHRRLPVVVADVFAQSSAFSPFFSLLAAMEYVKCGLKSCGDELQRCHHHKPFPQSGESLVG
jgi:hypothetical protein